jgi:hypothetical protein
VKAAAAVLAASLLFFVAVLTGAGRREALAPPAAIPLGVANEPAASGDSPATSATRVPDGGTGRTTTTTAGKGPSAATTPAGPAGPTATSSMTGSPTPPPPALRTTSTTGSGQVQQVDNQVDCRSAGKRGKGQREPCPSSPSSTTEAPGGGRNR